MPIPSTKPVFLPIFTDSIQLVNLLVETDLQIQVEGKSRFCHLLMFTKFRKLYFYLSIVQREVPVKMGGWMRKNSGRFFDFSLDGLW